MVVVVVAVVSGSWLVVSGFVACGGRGTTYGAWVECSGVRPHPDELLEVVARPTRARGVCTAKGSYDTTVEGRDLLYIPVDRRVPYVA